VVENKIVKGSVGNPTRADVANVKRLATKARTLPNERKKASASSQTDWQN
jgi:hypothetical protein